jgi:hypothetical protein
MADQNATISSTAAAPALGDASTPAAAIDSPLVLPTPGTPVDIDSLLAGDGDAKELGTGTPSEAGGDKTDGEPVKAAESEVKSDTETTPETEEGDPEEKEEAEALKQAESKEVPEWVPKRLSKMAEQKRALREENETLKSQIQAREEAEAKAAENPATPLPSSAIAHLDTADKLDAEVTRAAEFLRQNKGDPEGMLALYQDQPNGMTAAEQVAQWEQYALHVIQNQEGHRKLLTQRQATLEDVKKSTPAMFKPGTEDHAFYAKALSNPDLRSDPEFHQLMADAIRGRKARLELAKATASKVPAKKEVVKAPPIPVPSVATARASVKSDDAPDARQQVWQRTAKQESVSVDEMMDAGALLA